MTRRCWDGQGRPCPKPATVTLVAPDGGRVPGCAMCDAHAKEVIDEYREKLGEEWRAVPLCGVCGQPVDEALEGPHLPGHRPDVPRGDARRHRRLPRPRALTMTCVTLRVWRAAARRALRSVVDDGAGLAPRTAEDAVRAIAGEAGADAAPKVAFLAWKQAYRRAGVIGRRADARAR